MSRIDVPERREEHAIARHIICNRTDKVVHIEKRFAPLFHGLQDIPYGCYVFRCLVRDTGYNRLLTQLQLCYPQLKLEHSLSGLEEV